LNNDGCYKLKASGSSSSGGGYMEGGFQGVRVRVKEDSERDAGMKSEMI
jgi:hypothetical protein